MREHLAQRKAISGHWHWKKVTLVAINQTLMPLESAVKNGDEIAFFPPVTGAK